MIPFALLAFFAAATPPIVTSPPPRPPVGTDWKALAHRDVEAGYAIMRQNHPGFVNPDDPGFRSALEAARAAGNAAAENATGVDGYSAALAAFSTVLGDGHAKLASIADKNESPTRWPGFLAAWRGNGLYVVDGEAATGLGKGSRVVSCDGLPVGELLVSRLQPRAIRLHEAGQWWAYGTRALIDAANVAGPPPKACDIVRAQGGAAQRVALSYTDVPSDWMRRYWTASNGGFTDIGLSEPREGIFLVGLPTFAGTEEANRLYAALNADIVRRHAALADARAIVLDLRFNQGGSSAYSRDVASALWGKAAVDTRVEKQFRAVEVWWRNSPGNIERVDAIVDFLDKGGRTADAAELKDLAVRMRAGMDAGKDFTVEEPADLSTPLEAPAPAALRTQVYVIVPGQCASACLDALDVFTLMPNTTLVGAPSSGDSLYMDIRKETLPSGKGEAIIPLKVWMHRPRGGGDIYRPSIELRQADWSTDAFLDAIEADLPKREPTR